MLIVMAFAYVMLVAFHTVQFSWLAALLGALLFGVSEYTTHRFLLHAKPSANAGYLAFQRRMHYDHHVTPERLDLLFLPWWFVLPLAALFFAVYFAITRSVDIAGAMIFGSLLGTLDYEWVHFVAHVPYKPRTRWGRYMKKYHLWHHFKNEHLWFGVTNPAIDHLVRTYVRVDEADRSDSVRELYPNA